ncbi:MAG: histidine phosphatase family protein [Spirochaetota bacterium]
MKELLLIRHGETDHNRERRFTGSTDIPLNSTGREQALALHARFAAEGITSVYSSSLLRCRETAQIVSGIAPSLSPALCEMNFGIFETLTYDEATAAYGEQFSLWMKDKMNYRIPHGESYSEMAQRVLSFFSDLLSSDIERAAVVSHSGCIRAVLSYYLLGSIDDPWRFFVDNCTITRLCFDGDYAYLKSLNGK